MVCALRPGGLRVREKSFSSSPGPVRVESAASVVNGKEFVVDPLVVFGGFFVGHRYGQNDRVSWSRSVAMASLAARDFPLSVKLA